MSMTSRARAPRRALAPRFAALLRESWWLFIVAFFAYLALVLTTYARGDPGWSFSGDGSAIHNKGGVAGAWIADLLLYLFGASAWWWVFAGAILIVAGFHRLSARAANDSEFEPRHHPWLAVPGFACVLLASAALEALRLYRLPMTLPQGPGGALGQFFGGWLSKALGFNGATLLLIALLVVGWSLLTGMSWLRLMERIGGAFDAAVARLRARREERRDRLLGAAAVVDREHAVEAAREIELPHSPVLVVPPTVE